MMARSTPSLRMVASNGRVDHAALSWVKCRMQPPSIDPGLLRKLEVLASHRPSTIRAITSIASEMIARLEKRGEL